MWVHARSCPARRAGSPPTRSTKLSWRRRKKRHLLPRKRNVARSCSTPSSTKSTLRRVTNATPIAGVLALVALLFIVIQTRSRRTNGCLPSTTLSQRVLFFTRILQSLGGMLTGSDASLHSVAWSSLKTAHCSFEIHGPCSVERWMASYRTSGIATLILDSVSLSALDLYSDQIQRLSATSGPKLWLLLHQPNVRMSLEEWDTIQRWGELEATQNSDIGLPHNHRDTQPLEWTLRENVRDFEFWCREFERRAMFINAHMEKQNLFEQSPTWSEVHYTITVPSCSLFHSFRASSCGRRGRTA